MKTKQAQWIWYPNDFEVWLRREVELRRDERLVVTPPIWRVDSPYVSVRFKKKFRLDRPEHIEVRSDGTLRLVIDGVMQEWDKKRILLPQGEHEILAEVVNLTRLPALYVKGESLVSDPSWEVSHLQHSYVPAGWGGFTNSELPPSSFRLEIQPIKAELVQRIGSSLFVDFGKETFGYIRLHGVRGIGKVRLQYGESAEEANETDHCETFDVLQVETGEAIDFTLNHSRAMRYVKVVKLGDIQIENVSLLYEYLPVSYRGAFRSSNKTLNRIWEVSTYTLHLNTREFFLDGIKRDRWVWSGDAYQSYLMNYYLFFDLEVTQRTIVALRGKDPIETHLNTILDYSLYWFMGLNDYYQYTGDLDFIRRQYGKMLGLMKFCISRANPEGMLEGLPEDWVFVDWAEMEKEGELTFIQMLFYLSLATVVRLATLLNDKATATFYQPLAEKLRRNIREKFWDAERGAFIHRRINGQLDNFVTRHPNMFAILYGFLEPGELNRIKHTVMKNPEVPEITTPYMRFYELAAMCEIGEHEYVVEEILDYWGGMLKLGATTFWEAYDPEVPVPEQYAMYGRPYGKSLCHAWGASPIFLLGKYFLGVTPAAPGYRETLIRPNLGGLDWIEGSVPTPAGEVNVFMDPKTIRVSVPYGSAVVQFESSKRPEVSEGKLIELAEGRYELRIDQPHQIYVIHYND